MVCVPFTLSSQKWSPLARMGCALMSNRTGATTRWCDVPCRDPERRRAYDREGKRLERCGVHPLSPTSPEGFRAQVIVGSPVASPGLQPPIGCALQASCRHSADAL